MKISTLTLSKLCVATLLFTFSQISLAEKDDSDVDVVGDRTIVIIGDNTTAQNLAGSGNLVSKKQLDDEVITDINQALKTVPGIYIREEDGFGLRPNIGIRAATGARSARITLMEDGVLIAPAPYSAPAAYYFPNTMRMSFIEVMKGAPLLRYGPFTTGGILNLVTTQVPQQASGKITVSTGSHGSNNINAYYGATHDNLGWSLEVLERNSDGFKNIDNSQKDSGFSISDYVAKVRWESTSGPRQDLQLKLQRSFERSNETYLGLSETDFAENPNRRYKMSELDQMDNDHLGVSLNYGLEVSDSTVMTANIYRNDFSRDWFKLSAGGSIIDDANNGDQTAQGILDGNIDIAGLSYKHNAREYYSKGIDVNFDILFDNHQIAIGARLHEDEEDRFQPIDVYDQINGELLFSHINQPSSSNNRVGAAEALSFWLTNQWQANTELTVQMALRYEDVETTETRYGDLNRQSIASSKLNNTQDWMAGLSATYDFDYSWQLLAGVHQGFSPLGAGAVANEEAETSTNWELGIRYSDAEEFFELISFMSEFSNKEEKCSVGTPCSDGSTFGRFVTGEADISGIEMQYHNQLQVADLILPLDITYTYTKAEITKTNLASSVYAGDQLRDIPENALSVRLGLETDSGWNHYAIAKYIDESCTQIGCNQSNSNLDKTESLLVMDWVSRVALTDQTDLFIKIENVSDEQTIISRVPDGPRPNLPRTFSIGLEVEL